MKPLCLLVVLAVCTGPRLPGASAPAIIPAPQRMSVRDEGFALRATTRIVAEADARDTAEYLATALRRATGWALPVEMVSAADPQRDAIVLTTRGANAELGDEGYELDANAGGILIRARTAAGLFHGTASLLQLLPPPAVAGAPQRGVNWTVPGVAIADWPRYPWRGMLIDAGRHFVPPDEVKRLLDVMALYKLNVLHWHLTEDQGWRLEIKGYPRLAEMGAWRASSPPYGDRKGSDGRRYGGFYTQAQVREIVAYAAARHITVVPEIEMPGHAAAAIAAYPQFGNDDIPDFHPEVATHWGVHPYTFAPKEETFRFLDEVLAEVCALFPSPYIHIGGDEAPKTQWHASAFAQSVMHREGLKDEEALQSWFIRRIEKLLAARHRRLVGWDEINEGGLPPTATMMVWRDAKWARFALQQGHDVIMTTKADTYFNFYQAPAQEELAKGPRYEQHGSLLTLERAYAYNPSFVVADPAQAPHVLGTEAALWGEFIKDAWKLEYMAFPRTLALAEVAWTAPAAKDFRDFKRRLEPALQRLDALGVTYFH